MNVSTLPVAHEDSSVDAIVEFLVLRQDPDSRAYEWLGVLTRDRGAYRFAYTEQAATTHGIRPLPGFSDRTREYLSTELFATFANRVMTPRRDSYADYLQMIGLDGHEATPFEVLARTWGTRTTDKIQVLPVPRVDSQGQLQTRFLVHGGSHADPDASVLRLVAPGDRLLLAAEPENLKDPQAVLVCAHESGGRLGYVPRPLAPFIHALWQESANVTVVAEVVNLPSTRLASNQMRLLARLEATVNPSFDVMGALQPTT